MRDLEYYINEHDELGVRLTYDDDEVATIQWRRKDMFGKEWIFRHKEIRYLPYLTPIDKAVAEIMLSVDQ